MKKQVFLYKSPNHVANLNNMRLSGKLCDVTIKVDERELRAHKVILAANLKYFESMFLSEFQESKQDVITMEGVEGTHLEAFISFVYTGEILLTDSNALDLLVAANYLREDGIKGACIEFLTKHLRAEEACRAYKFANLIDCLSLKNAAKVTITTNFRICSQSTEYLDFDYESLKTILRDVDLAPQLQQTLFEDLMRWILHDTINRRIHIDDLLSLIDMTELTSDYLMEYFYDTIKDQRDIIEDIMSFYRKIMQEHQSLAIVGVADKKLQVRFYNYTKKKWSRARDIADLNERDDFGSSTTSNNKFYHTTFNKDISKENPKIYLKVFDLSEKKYTMVASDSGLLRFSAMCACNRFIYFCGGYYEHNVWSDQILRYDSQKIIFETLTPMGTKRSNPAATFYQGYLLVLGGYCGGGLWSDLDSVEKYDPDTKEWTAFPSMCERRSRHAVAVLDGKLYACGGDNKKSVEVYDPSSGCWRQVASMNKNRSYFSVIALADKLLAIGGDNENTIEVYDPSQDQWKIDHEMSSGLQGGHLLGGGLTLSSHAS